MGKGQSGSAGARRSEAARMSRSGAGPDTDERFVDDVHAAMAGVKPTRTASPEAYQRAQGQTRIGGRVGDNKVFINHAWAAYRKRTGSDIGLPQFKERLVRLNNRRQIDLGRADLVEALHPGDVRESETGYMGTSFHFVRTR